MSFCHQPTTTGHQPLLLTTDGRGCQGGVARRNFRSLYELRKVVDIREL
jgi:hypothetical protein